MAGNKGFRLNFNLAWPSVSFRSVPKLSQVTGGGEKECWPDF